MLAADCDDGVVLLGYVGRHHHFGDLVLVLLRIFGVRIDKLCSVFDASAYFQFYPATGAIGDSVVAAELTR